MTDPKRSLVLSVAALLTFALGAVVALLLAPQTGTQTRRSITQRAGELGATLRHPIQSYRAYAHEGEVGET